MTDTMQPTRAILFPVMNKNTVANSGVAVRRRGAVIIFPVLSQALKAWRQDGALDDRHDTRRCGAAVALALMIVAIPARATPVVGSWVPIFKGVDHSVSTNIPSGGDFPNRQVVHALRVDLTDPDIRLLTTPRLSNYVAGVREIGGLTVSDFLRTNQLQAAINANFFDTTTYYLPAGTPMDVYGLEISEGVVVSPQDGPTH